MNLSAPMTKDRIGKLGIRGLLPALLVAVGYYWGAKIGFALTFEPVPIAILWPPNTVLLAGLLMTSPSIWWLILFAAFLSHLATQLQSGAPIEMVLGWFALLCVSGVAFISGFDPAGFVHLLLYVLLPILLCAAVQFNPFVTSISFLLYLFVAVWGALLGQGEFVDGSDVANTLALQSFLIGISVPFLLLLAATQEWRKSRESLRYEEKKLSLVVAAAQVGIWEMDIATNKGVWSPELRICSASRMVSYTLRLILSLTGFTLRTSQKRNGSSNRRLHRVPRLKRILVLFNRMKRCVEC